MLQCVSLYVMSKKGHSCPPSKGGCRSATEGINTPRNKEKIWHSVILSKKIPQVHNSPPATKWIGEPRRAHEWASSVCRLAGTRLRASP